MDNEYKIVEYDCNNCKNRDLDQSDDICHECLQTPVNLHSRKPINFEQRTITKEIKHETDI